jgi:hypothetical protein
MIALDRTIRLSGIVYLIAESEKKSKDKSLSCSLSKVTGRFVTFYKPGLFVDREMPSGYNLKYQFVTRKKC